MKLIKGAKLGDVPTRDLSRSERIDRYVRGSEIMTVASPHDSTTPNALHIEIHGDLAVVPKLKQNYRSGKGGRFHVDSKFLEQMAALDRLWKAEREGKPAIHYGDTHIHMQIVCSSRERGDPRNVAETIADWLEGRMKFKRNGEEIDRGWGIGLIDDDKHITCHALYGWQFGLSNDCTIISIRPWELIHEAAVNFRKEHYLD